MLSLLTLFREVGSLRSCGILLVLSLIACGTSRPEAESVEPDTRAQALSQPTWTMISCDGEHTGLKATPTPDTCGGPWEFKAQDLVLRADAAQCGTHCSEYNRCERWNHGVEASPLYRTTWTVTQHCTTRCDSTQRRPCIPITSCTSINPCTSPSPSAARLEATAIAEMSSEINGLELTGDEKASRKSALSLAIRNVTNVQSRELSATERTIENENEGGVQVRVFHRVVSCEKDVVSAQEKARVSSQCACKTRSPNTCYVPAQAAPTRRYTNPGAAKPVDVSNVINVVSSSVKCMTCDDKPVATEKYACLTGVYEQNIVASELPAGLTAASVTQAVVSRLKVLAELYAWDGSPHLSDAQFKNLLPLYSEMPHAVATCHVPLAISPAACASMGASNGLNARLQFCQNLLRYDVVTQGTRWARLDECLETFDMVGRIADATCHKAYLGVSTELARDLIQTNLRNAGWLGLRMKDGQLLGLPEAMQAIQAWYQHAQVAGGGSEWLRTESNAIVAGFWQHVQTATSLTLEKSAATAASKSDAELRPILDQLTGTGFKTDLLVAKAVVQSPVLDTPPLLLIFGDAMRSLVERAETLSETHDIVCRFRRCAPSSATRVGDLWSLFSVLNDRQALQQALTVTSRLRGARPEIWELFDLLAKEPAWNRFAKAYATAAKEELGEANRVVTSLGVAGTQPPSAATLHALITQAATRSRNFTTSGHFLGEEARVLYAGLQNRDLILSQFEKAVGQFEGAYGKYRDDRRGVVNALLTEISASGNEQALRARFDRLVAEMDDAANKIHVLKEVEQQERRAIEEMPARFQRLRDTGVFAAGEGAQARLLAPLAISARQARQDGTASNITNIAVVSNEWPVQLNKGQMLNFEIRGNWSPTCALPRSIAGPTGPWAVEQRDAVTGPEGWTIQWSNGAFATKSKGWDASVTGFVKTEACTKASAGAPGWVKLVFGAEASGWVQACVGVDASASASMGGQSGEESRTSASFGGGIRLGGTPLPMAPAGALLLVTTEHGNPSKVVDVRVAHRQSGYIAPKQVDAYLVINDKAGCATSETNSLLVNASVVTSFGDVAPKLAIGMASALDELEKSSAAIVAQGGFLDGETARVQGRIQERLLVEEGLDLTQFSPMVRVFFETYLAA